ncbi:glycosyltransferase family 2 protein [Rubripirellula amarantea]|nr:glycosyltransferase family 2 protein [Rubripirellula amarantea]
MNATLNAPKLISVVLSTYNQPVWLAKVLRGYQSQTFRNFEIVIADDGSGTQTREVVKRFQSETDLTIRHIWHEDDGFRKCTILNRGIQASEGDYVLFSDGDCVPRADFVGNHHAAAKRGHFLSGGYYKLSMPLSEKISEQDIESGEAFELAWLRRQGLPFSHRWLRIAAGKYTAPFLNSLTTTRPTWNGNNSSGWKSDIVSAGGFDERMRYGGEDRELGERLENAGIHGIHIRFDTLLLHLDHGRGYANDEDLNRNLAIRRETRDSGRTRTDHGIARAA